MESSADLNGRPQGTGYEATDTALISNNLRYVRLGYVALNVTDIEISRHFYETLVGLAVTGTGDQGEVFLRCSNAHHDLVLYPAKEAGLRRLGWLVESDAQLDHMTQLCAALDIAIDEVPVEERAALEQGRTVRFIEPVTGILSEFYAEMKSDYTYEASVAKIQRLGHVVLSTPDFDKAVRFYKDKLNFRTSDVIDDRVTFMRCFPNPYHHSLGIGRGSSHGLHHMNFMVTEIDDIGKALWRYQKNDVPIASGPGRHPPSNSVFLYATDPDGLTVEYSFGMEEFPESDPREARILPAVPESVDTWGAPPLRATPLAIA
jgi:2,3-dihydroxy-p-cumate/2,3-dihydroxybenzoate 3,4-dioxygenase